MPIRRAPLRLHSGSAGFVNLKNIEQEMPRNASAASTPSRKKPGKRVRKIATTAVLERSPVLGWRTSDEDEIALRRWRGRTEVQGVVALDPDRGFFGEFRVRSASQSDYEVEIRSLDGLTNSCGCIDHRVNALGTCKHIEGVLAALRRGKARAFRAAAAAGSPRIEIFLDRRGEAAPAIAWPRGVDETQLADARDWLRPWLHADGDDDGGAGQNRAIARRLCASAGRSCEAMCGFPAISRPGLSERGASAREPKPPPPLPPISPPAARRSTS